MIGIVDLKDIDRDGERFERHAPFVVCQLVEVDADSMRPFTKCDQPGLVVQNRRCSLNQCAEFGFETFASLAEKPQLVSQRSRNFFVIEGNYRLRRVALLGTYISKQALDGGSLRLDSVGAVALRPRDLLSDDVGIRQDTAYEDPKQPRRAEPSQW